jgi:type II secretory ATPase GspE/PulE/Tfp pilus assembly ATPase PilB-like protein
MTMPPLLPKTFANEFQCIPMSIGDDILVLGITTEPDPSIQDHLSFFVNKSIQFQKITPSQWNSLYSQAYENDSLSCNSGPKPLFHQLYKHNSNEPEFNNNSDQNAVQKIDAIVSEAIYSRASDIHVETFEEILRIRYRIDGVLQQVGQLPIGQKSALISRIKIMADLDIAERRRPQDGRITVSNGPKSVDIRVSTLPTSFGEKIVMRLLDKSAMEFTLPGLGMSQSQFELVSQKIHFPNGILLVTGPTGSGKSTTLYAMLKELNDNKRNIVTIEDPVEYDISGINQAHARADIGFSFAQALRTFLRQDPDIIMVGEIRDAETAEMAIRAALTGHLVLSTLHTNDAVGAITRLVDMGVPPFLLAASLRLVIAQRLVRVLCPHCKKPIESSQRAALLHIKTDQPTWYEPSGCDFCRMTGFKGRTALFQILDIDEQISHLIEASAPLAQLRENAQGKGLSSLRELGIQAVEKGETSIAEVLRETMS